MKVPRCCRRCRGLRPVGGVGVGGHPPRPTQGRQFLRCQLCHRLRPGMNPIAAHPLVWRAAAFRNRPAAAHRRNPRLNPPRGSEPHRRWNDAAVRLPRDRPAGGRRRPLLHGRRGRGDGHPVGPGGVGGERNPRHGHLRRACSVAVPHRQGRSTPVPCRRDQTVRPDSRPDSRSAAVQSRPDSLRRQANAQGPHPCLSRARHPSGPKAGGRVLRRGDHVRDHHADRGGGDRGPRPARPRLHPAERSPIRNGCDRFDLDRLGRGSLIPSVLRRSGSSRRPRALRRAGAAAGRASARSRSAHGPAVAPTQRPAGGCQRRIHPARDRCDAALVLPLPSPAERPAAAAWPVAAGSTAPPFSAHCPVPVRAPIPVRPNQSGRRERAFPRVVSAGGEQAPAASPLQEVMRA